MKPIRAQCVEMFLIFAGVAFLAGCAKHVTASIPQSPPPPAAPTISLTVSPGSIQQGQSATLTWHTENASETKITGFGAVSSSGSRTVNPTTSTTYTLAATGPGGTRETSARVTVNGSVANHSVLSGQELLSQNVKDVFFDYDQYVIRPDQAPEVDSDARFLAQHPQMNIVIEGHCDDRGSEDYNLALGDSRAKSVKQALVTRGVKPDQISVISYGKEKPFCSSETEQCWQQNRRGHFAAR